MENEGILQNVKSGLVSAFSVLCIPYFGAVLAHEVTGRPELEQAYTITGNFSLTNLYILGFLIAGVILGALRPYYKNQWGAFLGGVAISLIGYPLFWYTIGLRPSWDIEIVGKLLVLSVFTGPAVALLLYTED